MLFRPTTFQFATRGRSSLVRLATVAAVGVAVAAVEWMPNATAVTAGLTMLGQVALLGISGVRPRVTESATALAERQKLFLSVHIPACREPASVVIGTLESLRRQVTDVAHEVIVVINNTPDPAQWQPVLDWCHTYGSPFRCLRCDGLVGAKAGAMNVALAESDLRTTHILTVDADYQVEPTFLRDVTAQIAQGGSAFYQYPQAYRHMTPASEGIARELEDYFNRQVLSANLGQAMLLTGTLSVIPKQALLAVGGWPMESCTEDAELGTVLIGAGFRGVYVDQVVGRGIMPLSVGALHKQRHRWASGNARVFALWLPQVWRAGGMRLGRGLLIGSQLTAWLNLGAVAAVTLSVGLVQIIWGVGEGAAQMTLWFSAMTMVAIQASAFPLLSRRHRCDDPLQARFTSFWSRVATLPVAAWATVVGFLPLKQRF